MPSGSSLGGTARSRAIEWRSEPWCSTWGRAGTTTTRTRCSRARPASSPTIRGTPCTPTRPRTTPSTRPSSRTGGSGCLPKVTTPCRHAFAPDTQCRRGRASGSAMVNRLSSRRLPTYSRTPTVTCPFCLPRPRSVGTWITQSGFRILPFQNPRQASETLSINVLTKVDGGHGTGVDARLDWQAGDVLTTSVAYSFLNANFGFDGGTFLGSCVGCQPDVNTHALYALANVAVPDGWRAGTTLGALARGLDAMLTFRLATGLPYTRLVNNGDGEIAPQSGLGGGRLRA